MVFGVGLLAGGALSATVLWLAAGLAQPLPAPARHTLVLLAALLGVARDAKLVTIPLPQNARQVPQSVLQRGLRSGGLRFGFELGTGVRTYVSATAPYVVALALLLSGPGLLEALATGVGFGAGRALTALLRYGSRLAIDVWNRHLEARLTWITLGASASILVALALLHLR